MEHIVNGIHLLLIKNKKTVAVAESCTGGLVSKLLTDMPGSSQYFILGIVAYSDQVKRAILKVPYRIIAKYGAVSPATATAMAKSIRENAKTDFGIGVTGIAGPKGATPQKPVGTVFIAIDSKNKTLCKKFCFKGTRLTVRRESALKSLELLKLLL
jgi:nicotinamide-nucleotide amidase